MKDARRSDPDLAACASEPIHVPGAIQPHGCLLLVQPDSGRILQASANAPAVLGLPAEPHGRALHELFVPGGALPLEAVPAAGQDGLEYEAVLAGGALVHLAAHRCAGAVVVELEPSGAALESLSGFDVAFRTMAAAADLAALADACCSSLRAFTGFDRVMVYRFDEDGHGEVIAEARDPEMEPYLGQHYPESDIPRQARALYLRNWVRSIPDGRYTPVPLVPALRPDTGEPLDLSGAHLRSVSPVHLEYMANMGVAASMSVSLIVDGRLWGMISCGHRTPKPLPAWLRRAGETVGRLVSLRIGAIGATAFQLRRAQAASQLQELRDAMAERPAGLLRGLLAQPAALLELVGAGGAAVVDAQGVACIGDCPDAHAVRQLARHVQEQAVDGLFCTRQLGADVPGDWQGLAALASGLLGVTVGNRQLLWFRPQVPHTIVWGGDPNKTAQVEQGPGGPRIHPRRSFAMWQEEIRGRSLPWQPADLHLARELRRHAIEVDLGHQVELEQAAVRARDDLVAVVSHDLRTPVSVVAMQATLLQRFLSEMHVEGSKRLLAGAQTIQRAADRMTALLRDLLDLAKIEDGRFQVQPTPHDAGQLVHDACELMRHVADAKGVRLVAEEDAAVRVLADPERVFQVFANLVGNAIKFTPAGGTITVSARAEGDANCSFEVRDTGAGMAPAQLEHIFERYWQGKTREQSAGAGLGLYICRGIVEAHGGQISADSALGAGSVFRFTLPRAP